MNIILEIVFLKKIINRYESSILHFHLDNIHDIGSPAFIGRRQQHFNFKVVTKLHFSPRYSNEEAGITAYMDEKHHYDLFLNGENGKYYMVLRYRIGSIIHEEKRVLVDGPDVILQINGTPEYYTFNIQTNALQPALELGKVETKYLSSEVAGGFTGVYLGLYSTGNGIKSNDPADFEWFDYAAME